MIRIITGIHINLLALACIINISGLNIAKGQTTYVELPQEKKTTIGLYVTAKDAYEMWKIDPGKVNVLDVRTPEEYIYIGHAAMARNIPLLFQTYKWDTDKMNFPMKPNPDFIKQIQQVFKQDDTILVTCRSGGRSAMAVNQLAAAGFRNVYNITDGFEGDMVSDPESVYIGQRLKNGWKNSGLPYTYKIDPGLMSITGRE